MNNAEIINEIGNSIFTRKIVAKSLANIFRDFKDLCRERPRNMHGQTIKMKTSLHNLMVWILDSDDYEVELAQSSNKEKKTRKLKDVLKNAEGACWTHDDLAIAAIDAVIECYETWDNRDSYDLKTFPEYLKEKLL